MHVGDIKLADAANGPGIRMSVFVSGCTIHCPGCFQPQTWDFEFGEEYDDRMEQYILDELGKPYYSGLTILGGEPFEESNQAVLAVLLQKVRERYPRLSLWMFTGYIYDRDLVPGGRKYTADTDKILDLLDVLVDGPFMKDKKNLRLRFRGSENQRILDLKETRRTGRIMFSSYQEPDKSYRV